MRLTIQLRAADVALSKRERLQARGILRGVRVLRSALREALRHHVVGSRCAEVDGVGQRKVVAFHELVLLPVVEAMKRVDRLDHVLSKNTR